MAALLIAFEFEEAIVPKHWQICQSFMRIVDRTSNRITEQVSRMVGRRIQ